MNEIQHLWMAVEEGNDDAFERLLRAGANLEATDGSGRTALVWAVDKGEDGMVRTLLAAGANPNTTDHAGEQPLDIAARIGLTDITPMLLDAGAEIRPEMLQDRYWTEIIGFADDEEQVQLTSEVRRMVRAHQLSRELLAAMGDGRPSPSSPDGTPSL